MFVREFAVLLDRRPAATESPTFRSMDTPIHTARPSLLSEALTAQVSASTSARPPAPIGPELFNNRELSWLQVNQRVVAEALMQNAKTKHSTELHLESIERNEVLPDPAFKTTALEQW